MALPHLLTVSQVSELLERLSSNVVNAEDYDEASQPLGAREERTQALSQVVETCRYLWQAGAGELDGITEKLGNASRNHAWRLPFGDSGVLDFFFSILGVDYARNGLNIHALRVIGNSCADTDVNRQRVVDGNYIPAVVKCLDVEALVPYAIPVLYNILVDYEPTQIAASQALVTSRLITLFTTSALPALTSLLHFLPKILSLLASHPSEADFAPASTPATLLTLSIAPLHRSDIESFISLATIAAAYLAGPKFQQALVASPQEFTLFLKVYENVNAVDVKRLQAEEEDEELVQQVTNVRISLLNLLADMSAHDQFLSYHAADGPVVQTLKGWLAGGPNVAAGCLAMGNIARSDEMAVAVVQHWGVHIPLIGLLSDSSVTDSQVIHAAMGFLKNLALPASNKPILGGELLKGTCVPRFYTMDVMPQIQFMAVSLTRLLLVNCPSNVAELCEQLAPPSDPGFTGDRGVSSPKVSGLLSVFQRSDAEPTKLEAARAIAGLCRVLHSTPDLPFVLPGWDPSRQAFIKTSQPPEGKGTPVNEGIDQTRDTAMRQSFYEKQDLREPLRYLIAQSKWPILRSEAWFVFALMSRSPDGAKLILNVLAEPLASGSLVQAITGQTGNPSPQQQQLLPSQDQAAVVQATPEGMMSGAGGMQLEPQEVDPQQKESMARVDRENAVVMCTELLKLQGEVLGTEQSRMLRDLVVQGTQGIAGVKMEETYIKQEM